MCGAEQPLQHSTQKRMKWKWNKKNTDKEQLIDKLFGNILFNGLNIHVVEAVEDIARGRGC